MTKEEKGKSLERQSHKFLWHLGYLPRAGVSFAFEEVPTKTTVPRFEEATDLDCLGYRFDGYLNLTRFLIDCKHRSEGVLKQILRNKGIQSIFSIDHVLLLRSSLSIHHKQFANEHGLSLMRVKDLLERCKKLPEFGSFSMETYEKLERFENSLTSDLKRSVLFPMRNTFLVSDPFDRTKRLVSLSYRAQGNILEKEIAGDVINPKKWLLYELLENLALTIAEVSGWIIDSSPSLAKRDLTTKLAGDIEFKKSILRRIETSEYANSMTFEAFSEIPLDLFSPTYTDEMYKVVKFLTNRPHMATKYLRALNFVVHEFILHQKPVNMKLVMNTIGIDESTYEEFGQLNKGIVMMMAQKDSFLECMLPVV